VGVGATIGGITGGLIGFGIPEFEAKRYEGKIKAGNILISVHTKNTEELTEVWVIFRREGGDNISSTAESRVPKSARLNYATGG